MTCHVPHLYPFILIQAWHCGNSDETIPINFHMSIVSHKIILQQRDNLDSWNTALLFFPMCYTGNKHLHQNMEKKRNIKFVSYFDLLQILNSFYPKTNRFKLECATITIRFLFLKAPPQLICKYLDFQ